MSTMQALILIIALIALVSVILGVRHIRRHRQELAAIECKPTLVMFQATLPYNVKWLNRHELEPFQVNLTTGEVSCVFSHSEVTLSPGILMNPINGTVSHVDCAEAIIRQFLIYIEQTLDRVYAGKTADVFATPMSSLTSMLTRVAACERTTLENIRTGDNDFTWHCKGKYIPQGTLYGSGGKSIIVHYDGIQYMISPEQLVDSVFRTNNYWSSSVPILTLDAVVRWVVESAMDNGDVTLFGDSDLVHLLSAIYDDECRTIKEIARRAAGIAACNLTLDEDISGWDVGKVTKMDSMLTDCSNFNSECTDTTQAVIATMDTDDVSDDTTRRSKKDRVITVSGDAFEHSPTLRHTPGSLSSTSDSSSDSSGSSSSSSFD